MWFFYDVTHRLHRYCNPISADKIEQLGCILDLQQGMRVLDIACGFGQLLITYANDFGIHGVGVDASPLAVKRALKRKREQAPNAEMQFVHERGENYRLADDEQQYDVVMCIGASWIWNGYEGTVKAMRGFCKPSGLLVVGEPHWKTEPSAEYLATQDFDRTTFFTLHENVTMARDMGLRLVYLIVSNEDDWDQYETLQVAGVDRFARENPDHPDLPAIRERVDTGYESYLKWGRDTFGFATLVFRVPESE
ncbi:MAG: class I SAM-dependent methyltransferase [Planctomycetes bacterium]|nr:class I SAM-dependent methyltransferase [Planctomycetota bacterium]